MAKKRRNGKVIGFSSTTDEVGSTTLIHNIAYELVRRDKQVLIIDFTPDARLTTLFGLYPNAFSKNHPQNILNIFEENKMIPPIKVPVPMFTSNNMTPTTYRNIDLIPSHDNLSMINDDSERFEELKSRFIYYVKDRSYDYDYILIDTNKHIDFIKESFYKTCHILVFPISSLKNFANESEDRDMIINEMYEIDKSSPNKLTTVLFIPINSYLDDNFASFANNKLIENVIVYKFPKLHNKYKIKTICEIFYYEIIIDAQAEFSFVYEYLRKTDQLSENKSYLSQITEITDRLEEKSNCLL